MAKHGAIELSYVDFSRLTDAQIKARKANKPSPATVERPFDAVRNVQEDIDVLQEVISTPASVIGRAVKEKLQQELAGRRARLAELKKEKTAKVRGPVLLGARAGALAG